MLALQKINTSVLTIPSSDVSFHPHSFADDAGRLFSWQGQLLRGISHRQTAFFGTLFRERVVQRLVELGLLIDSHQTDLSFEGYGSVVSHRSIPFISYPTEWCAAMLKDAALVVIDLAAELARHGLTLKDAHPWNVLFDSSRPVYVDLTSIIPQNGDPSWRAYDEFCRFCYYPLILMSHGHERIARSLLTEYQGVLRTELLTVMRGTGPSRFIFSKLLRRGIRSIQSLFRRESARDLLGQARRDLEEIQLPSYEERNRRRRYQSMLSTSDEKEWRPRSLALRRILTELRPGAVLDLSRGAIWTSTLPAIMGFNVVSIDADAARVTALYEIAREKNLPILPLIVDFVKPTPSVGYSNHYSIPAVERLKCDMVVALGLVNEMASEKHFNFELIAEGLSSFSNRWLLVEVDDRDRATAAADQRVPGTLEDFIEALLTHFRDVSIVSSGSHTGHLLLCEK